MGLLRDIFLLVRGLNLIIILFCQLLVSVFLFDNDIIELFKDHRFVLLLISTLLVAAGGNVINDYYDVKIDVINKPKKVKVGRSITRMQTIMLHYGLNLLALVLAYFVTWKLAALDLAIITALWLYSHSLKCVAFIGNLVVSVLTAMVIYILVLYFKEVPMDIRVIGFCCFAFVLSMIREMVKDMQDIKGDNTQQCKTLPVVIGIAKAKVILLIFAFFHLIGLVLVMLMSQDNVFKIYFLIAVILPSVAFTVQIFRANNKADFRLLSNLIKLAMFTGIVSAVFL